MADPLRDAAQALRAIIDDDVYVHTLSGLAQFRANTLATARAALAAADTAPLDWTCPACRRGDHTDCLDAGPGVCRCAARDHGAAADGTTPTQPDEVPALWEGPLDDLVSQLDYGDIGPALEAVRSRAPGSRVRVVATKEQP